MPKPSAPITAPAWITERGPTTDAIQHHARMQTDVLAEDSIGADHAMRADHGAFADGRPGSDHGELGDRGRSCNLRRRIDVGGRMDPGRGARSGMQQRRDLGKRRVGIVDDELRQRRCAGVGGRDDHGGRVRRRKLRTVAAVGEERDGCRVRHSRASRRAGCECRRRRRGAHRHAPQARQAARRVRGLRHAGCRSGIWQAGAGPAEALLVGERLDHLFGDVDALARVDDRVLQDQVEFLGFGNLDDDLVRAFLDARQLFVAAEVGVLASSRCARWKSRERLARSRSLLRRSDSDIVGPSLSRAVCRSCILLAQLLDLGVAGGELALQLILRALGGRRLAEQSFGVDEADLVVERGGERRGCEATLRRSQT